MLLLLQLADPVAATIATQAASPPTSVVAVEQGVVSYSPSFFSEGRPNTALDMLSRVPGFTLEDGQSNRGFAGAAGNVLVNGKRPATKSESLETVLRAISAGDVERINVIRGGASGIDMQGRSILANVVLSHRLQIEQVLDLQSYVYADGFWGPIVEYRASRRDGADLLEGSIFATRDQTDATFYDARSESRSGAGSIIARAALNGKDKIQNYILRGKSQRGALGGRLELNGKLGYSTSDRSLLTDRLSPPSNRETSGEASEDRSGEFSARYDSRIGRTTVQALLLHTFDNQDYRSRLDQSHFLATFDAKTRARETIVRAEARRTPNEKLSFETSFEVAYNVLQGDNRYAENGLSVDLPAAHVTVEELRGEGAGKVSWRPRRQLSLELGLLMEASRLGQSGDTDMVRRSIYPKPQFLAAWSPRSTDQVRLRVQREVSQLDFNDFVSSAALADGTFDGADAKLAPSRTWVSELTWERRFWTSAVLTTSMTHGRVTDVIDFKPVGQGPEAPSNIGSGHYRQIQVMLTLPTESMGLSRGQLKLQAADDDSAVTDPVTGAVREISGRTPFSCRASLTRDTSGGRWTWGVVANCPQTTRYYRTGEIQTYRYGTWLEASIEWKPRADLSLRIQAQNLASQTRKRERVFFAAGRAAPLTSVETRTTTYSPLLLLQLRKTLG